jgi:hypothetical protein
MKIGMLWAVVLCVAGSAGAQPMDARGRPLNAVPDARTAVAVGEAVLSGIYGADSVKQERPFKAELQNGEWLVQGTLRCAPNCLGGTMAIVISRKDARVKSVLRTK